jgi:hypothetical protein
MKFVSWLQEKLGKTYKNWFELLYWDVLSYNKIRSDSGPDSWDLWYGLRKQLKYFRFLNFVIYQ